MKLFISQVGIVDSVSSYLSDIKSQLNGCKYMNLTCPGTFQYASYVGSLKEKANKHYKETNYIENALKKSERKYENLFQDATRKIDSVTEKKMIEKRAVYSDIV